MQEVGGAGLPAAKLFEVVPGAVLRVENATPGATVEAATSVASPRGRRFSHVVSAVADAAGAAELRLPYATGVNGATLASAYVVREGERGLSVSIAQHEVLGRGEVKVRLP